VPATGKARLPTVDSLLVGTTRRLVKTERSDRRLDRSATRVKGPRYPGASTWTTCQYATHIAKTSHFTSYNLASLVEHSATTNEVQNTD